MSDQCLRLPFGAPPLRPFARAAAIFAADLEAPPLRPRLTAAGFLRGTPLVAFHVSGDVLRRQFGDPFHRQVSDLEGQLVHARPVARVDGGVALGHQVTFRSVHVPNIPKRPRAAVMSLRCPDGCLPLLLRARSLLDRHAQAGQHELRR